MIRGGGSKWWGYTYNKNDIRKEIIMERSKWDFADLKKRMQAKATQPDIISIVDRFKTNERARANMVGAMVEDEVVRLASEANSTAYLQRKDEADKTPFWMWCSLYFTLGVLFMISIDNVFYSWSDIKILLGG